MEGIIFNEKRLYKHIGAILFGLYLSATITDSAYRGIDYIFSHDSEDWGFAFWGDHYKIRIISSLIGTIIGSLSAGIISKTKGQICGLITSIPTSIFWLISFLLIYQYGDIQNLQLFNWFVIATLFLFSPIVGFLFGKFGTSLRQKNPEFFEARKNTVLAIKWYHWIWLLPAISWTGALFTYSVYQGLNCLYKIAFSLALFNLSLGLTCILVFLSLAYLLIGIYKTIYLLSLGFQQNINNGQIALRVIFWTIGIWIIVGTLQVIVNYFFRS
jgi:hypothetical protein